jgi:N-acetylneuraminic acid mutarotase
MQTTWWTRPRSAILSVLVAALSACGGGGDEEVVPPPQDHPANIGAGRVRIEAPAQNPYATDRDSVLLSGSAFVSPTHYRCCSGSAADTAVSVGWSNSAGGGGSASQSVRYCSFFGFGPVGLCEHTWSTWVPLAVGSNIITISAHDTDGNVGYDSIRVTRVPDTTPPSVSSTYPADRAANVPENSYVGVAFSESIDPASVTPDAITIVDRDGNRLPGTIAADNPILGARSLQFVVAGSLATNMLYTATAGTGVRDESGNALQAPRVWSFTTGVAFDVAAPTVTATTPPNATSCAFTDTVATVTFSEGIDASTVNDQTFQLTDGVTPVSGSVSALSQDTFRFSPHGGLRYATSYLATLASGIKDLAGNPIAANHTWIFSTVAAGTGRWRSTAALTGAAGSGHTAVWTGTEMIVWGGNDIWWFSPDDGHVGDGYRYDPATDAWAPLSDAGAPSARRGHVAVWTGSEMIVWGGSIELVSNPGNPPQVDTVLRLDGARYHLASDTWSPISSVNAPIDPATAAVWTGGEMIVWTGAAGAKYDPTTDSWRALPAPQEPILGAKAAWTGSKLIVWGSSAHAAGSTGAVYDPATNSWQAISNANAPRRLGGQSVVWTGTELIVWGGYGNGEVDSGAIYNLEANAWRPLTNCGASPRAEHTAVWSGAEMIVWGGSNANTGQAYDPITDTWRQLDVVNAPAAPGGHTAVWTGHAMIVWGGATGGVYVP